MKKQLICLLMSFAASFLLAVDNGFLTVGKGTPVIDGKISDAEWNGCIVASPFLLSEQTRLAKEQTSVRFLWDDENLYVAFHCVEKMLRPSDNRLSAFQRNYKQHDKSDEIYNDDIVEVLLFNPATPKQVYDIVQSASGAYNDSVSAFKGIDLWSFRDRSWESGMKSAVYVSSTEEKYFWSAEMAIPWKNLGGKPQPKVAWKVMTARFEKASKEISAFQYIPSGGIHEFDKFSELRFKNNAPGIELAALPAFVPGKNTLEFRNTGSVSTLITSVMEFDDKKVRTESRINRKAASGKHDVDLNGKGDFRFTWQIAGSSDFTDYFRSPSYPCKVSSSILRVQLSDAILTVNGSAVDKETSLTSGKNILKVKMASDKASVLLTTTDSAIEFPNGWLRDEKSGEYLLNLYVGASEIWPNWNTMGLSITKGGIQQLLFHPQGIPGMTLDDYAFYLDLPEGVTLVGASGYYKIYPLNVRQVECVLHNNRKFSRYCIQFNKAIPYRKQLNSHEYIAAVLCADENLKDNESEFYYHVGSRKANIAELPNRVKLHILPPAVGKQPPLPLRIQLWGGWLPAMDNMELRKIFSNYLAKAGFTETGPAEGLTTLGNGLRGFQTLSFEDWNFSCIEYISRHPEFARIDSKGVRSAKLPCSTALLREKTFNEFFRGNLKAWMDKWHHPVHVCWDYEHDVFNTYLACYCPRCMDDFACQEKIAEKNLNSELIKQKYAEQWIHYMDQRMADVAEFFRNAIHSENPNVILSVYSGYQNNTSKRGYGLDWKMLSGRIDLGMIGYGRIKQEVEDTRNALGKTPMLLGAILYPYDFTARYMPNYAGCARLLRRACDAQAGFLVYSFETVDGRTISAVAEVSRYMADYADFFTSGLRETSRLKIRGWDSADYEVLCDGKGNYLFAIMNSSSAPRKFQAEMTLPAGKRLVNAKTGQEVMLPVSGELQGEDVVVFVTR